jgi:hypothetical protein
VYGRRTGRTRPGVIYASESQTWPQSNKDYTLAFALPFFKTMPSAFLLSTFAFFTV